MGLIDDCEQYFGCKNLYEVLGIEKKASPAQIKKAYRKLSLLVHPDRAQGNAQSDATRKFQILSKVHLILSDAEKRTVYDETGIIDEEDSISENDTPELWEQYWRNLFPKLTLQDVENFFQKYRGSEEEKNDLKDCFVKYEGDMNLISENFLGYHVDEEDRIRDVLMDMINKEEVPPFQKFMKESKTKRAARIKRMKTEEVEAEKMKKELMGGESDLVKAISRRNQERESNFNNMIKSLEDKYGKKETKGKKKR